MNSGFSKAVARNIFIFSLLAAVLLTATDCRRKAGGGKAPSGEGLASLPTLETVDGRKIVLSENAGKVVILNRWASWCGPCRLEIPELVKLRKKFGSDDLAVYGLNEESKEIQEQVARNLGIDYPLLKDPGDLRGKFAGSGFVPESFLIGRDGILHEVILGFRPPEEFEKSVRALLDSKK